MPKITIIKIIHFTIDFLLAGFYNYFLNDTIYMEFAKKKEQMVVCSFIYLIILLTVLSIL